MVEVKRVCPLCGAMNVLNVPKEGYAAWLNGIGIQHALSELSPGERELLMSGICEPCFDRMFANL